MYHAALLDPPVMAAPNDLAVANQDRTDGNAAFRKTSSRLLNCCLQKYIQSGYCFPLAQNVLVSSVRCFTLSWPRMECQPIYTLCH